MAANAPGQAYRLCMTTDAPSLSDRADLAPLELQWDAAMEDIYQRAGNEAGYWAGRFHQMLGKRGGLGTARFILNKAASTDGYAHLRAVDRLDLSVEAYALRPEFSSLFTDKELDLARTRLAFEQHIAAAEARAAAAPAPELALFLAQVAQATPNSRHEYRDRIASFGPPAIPALEAWVAQGNSPAFALKAIEAIGRNGERHLATEALRRMRGDQPEIADLIDLAILGLKG